MKTKLIILVLFLSFSAFSQENFKRTLKLMGTRFDITVVASSEKEANHNIDLAINEIVRIEKLKVFLALVLITKII